MIPVIVEGVRRNFLASSAFLYSACLLDERGQRLLIFSLERHEAMPLVAALNQWTLPRPESLNLFADTLAEMDYSLEAVHIESHSMLPPLYNLCLCELRWRSGEHILNQRKQMRPGDALGLALLLHAPLLVSESLFQQMGIQLARDQTPELLFAHYLLRQQGISLPVGHKLRLGYSKTPLRDALIKEFKATLSGKAPVFPEENMQERKQAYLDFLLGEGASTKSAD